MVILMGVFTTVNILIHVPTRGRAVTTPHNNLWGCSNHIYKETTLREQAQSLLLSQIMAFIKDYILLLYDSKQPTEEVPSILPPVVHKFFTVMCLMMADEVNLCWE